MSSYLKLTKKEERTSQGENGIKYEHQTIQSYGTKAIPGTNEVAEIIGKTTNHNQWPERSFPRRDGSGTADFKADPLFGKEVGKSFVGNIETMNALNPYRFNVVDGDGVVKTYIGKRETLVILEDTDNAEAYKAAVETALEDKHKQRVLDMEREGLVAPTADEVAAGNPRQTQAPILAEATSIADADGVKESSRKKAAVEA